MSAPFQTWHTWWMECSPSLTCGWLDRHPPWRAWGGEVCNGRRWRPAQLVASPMLSCYVLPYCRLRRVWGTTASWPNVLLWPADWEVRQTQGKRSRARGRLPAGVEYEPGSKTLIWKLWWEPESANGFLNHQPPCHVKGSRFLGGPHLECVTGRGSWKMNLSNNPKSSLPPLIRLLKLCKVESSVHTWTTTGAQNTKRHGKLFLQASPPSQSLIFIIPDNALMIL